MNSRTFDEATRIGLEPTTPSVTGWCSNQLSYRAIPEQLLLLLNGAADEARTRYLHLGKVALYQMSYGRIFGAFVPAPSHSYFKRGPRKNLRSKVLWGRGESLAFITAVLLARLLDEQQDFRRSDPDRARTDDPQRDRLVL